MNHKNLLGGKRRAIAGAVLALVLSLFVVTAGIAGNMHFSGGG